MDFIESKAIYLQIVNLVYHKILLGEWTPSERIPAVRELAVSLEVNPNTVMRTYQYLENMNVINVKRGTGYYLTENAYEQVYSTMRKEFLETSLPQLFKNISLLKFTPDEIRDLYQAFLNQNK